MIHKKSKAPITIVSLLILTAVFVSPVKASIFDSGSGGGGIFNGVSNAVGSLFGGSGNAPGVSGGGIVPGEQADPQASELLIRAAGSYAFEQWTHMQLRIDGDIARSWEVNSDYDGGAGYRDFITYVPLGTTASQIEVHFINDESLSDLQDPAQTRDLYVDYIQIDGGAQTQAESATFQQVEVVSADGSLTYCTAESGSGRDVLTCNGCFHFGGGVCEPVEPTSLRQFMPPDPSVANQVKLTLEWDALSIGGEIGAPQLEDPLSDIHFEYLCCPQCGGGFDGPCGSGSNAFASTADVDNQESDVLGRGIGGEGSRPNPAPVKPGGSNNNAPAVLVWLVCPDQGPCRKANEEHVLVGWCGQEPTILNEERVSENEEIPIYSPGPNMFGLPNSVSNKYIRRDGYAYECIKDCEGYTCIEENYMEFQTMVYPSNAFSMYLKVLNPSAQEIENVYVRANTLTYNPSGESVLPHNLDYLVAGENFLSDDKVIKHGSGLAAYYEGQGLAQDSEGRYIIQTVNEVDMKFDNSDPTVPAFGFGPFDMAPGEIIELPLQPETAEFDSIVGTEGTYSAGEVGLVEPAKPCDCQSVRIHGGDGDGLCALELTNPSVEICRMYYGIGVFPEEVDHAGGYICDRTGITVTGCPPPWCFEGAVSNQGPMDLCPGGAKIPLPSDQYWHYDLRDSINAENIQQYLYDDSLENRVKETLASVLPSAVTDAFSFLQPKQAEAFGCPQPCQNQAPPGQLGVGGIVPRDYNFVCDSDDPVEAARCANTDPEVLVPADSEYFPIYRDVTGLGGCGYVASSNNSVIGPMEFTAAYGGVDESRISRSVLVGSIPVGGQILDDNARPYGWPISGVITEDWGYTADAQGLGDAGTDQTADGGQYRYCSP